MATVTHTIYSLYDPKQREVLQRETGQILDGDDGDDAWKIDPAKRRIGAAPRFVAAVAPYGEWSLPSASTPTQKLPTRSEVSSWYKSLARERNTDAQPALETPSAEAPKAKKEARNKNNWFIMKAIHSEPSSSVVPPPTLADILERDPPPLPDEQQFTPPVFLALGPSNRGFAMLQQSGWNEGEALGPYALRRAPSSRSVLESRPHVKKERHYSDRPLEVIDLTLSDSDDDDVIELPEAPPSVPRPSSSVQVSSYPHKALLTPLPTVLKSDRLGLGLKAKTTGPFKASQKRVTHNAAALAAHIRKSEEMRRKKAELGRGSRGFARAKKKEEESRKRLLAYLNG